MRTQSVAEPFDVWQGAPEPKVDPSWLTTIDAARALRLTTRGVRWLVQQGRLACQRTRSGQYLFRAEDVLQAVQQRAAATLAMVRPRMVRVRAEPRQLSLFGRARLRLVAPVSPPLNASRSGSEDPRNCSETRAAASR
jgi:excisionase family DNA binding protein